MDTTILVTFGTIAILLVLSAFFSGSETALTAASPARMHTLEQQGDPRARVVNRLLAQKDRLIGAILLGNNLVNILASALATSLLISLVGEAGVAYATIGMTMLVLIFALQPGHRGGAMDRPLDLVAVRRAHHLAARRQPARGGAARRHRAAHRRG
jgi:Mg2+/Co2+ transporter CorB